MNRTVASFVVAVLAAPALAADAMAPLDRLVACVDVQDTRQRLACFDREIAPLAKSRTTMTPAPAGAAPAAPAVRNAPGPTPPAPAAPAPASAPPAAAFGQEQLATRDRPPVKDEELALHARIVSIREVSRGAWVVSLDNGQGWRHEDQNLGTYLRPGEAITISKGTLSTYRLTRDSGDAKNWIRVTRVR